MRTTAVRIEEDSLLGPAERVRVSRGDTTLTKTVRDLLREKLTEIAINGDPHAKASKSGGKRANPLQPA